MKTFTSKTLVFGAIIASTAIVGCMPEMTVEQMKAMRPQRPKELDRLNMFEGTWKTNTTMKMAGLAEELKGSAIGSSKWECDGWYLVERAEQNMGELGEMKSIAIWGWDSRAKKYRSWWFDSMGTMGTGTATFNEKTKTWHMKAKSASPFGRSVGAGHVKMTDDNTMEWSYNEWDGLKLIKFMEMEGTSVKQ